ncbi:MAG: type VI secretion system tube protein Hcp [Candidatus Rokubacteria bacterium]|nr:type VI secretion system tube protein Hcp [Candidatus Rokubacteria bacterium]
MKLRGLAVGLVLGVVALGLLPVWAQSPAAPGGGATRAVAPRFRPETFVKLEGVSGESAARPGWMEALSATRFDCGGHSFAFVHRVDRASAVLAQAMASGKRFPTGEVDAAGVRFTLRDVLVSSVTTASRAGDAIPAQTITLNFASCARN